MRNAAIVLGMLFAPVAVAAPTVQDFDDAGTAYALANGYSGSMSIQANGPTGNYLSMTTGYSQVGSIGFDRTEDGVFGEVVADFDFRHGVWQYGENGLNFLLLDTDAFGSSGAPSTEIRAESGATNSLSLGLSTYDVSQVYLQFDGVVYAKLPTPFDLRDGLFHHYRLSVSPVWDGSGGLFATLVIDPDGGAPAPVFSRVFIPGARPSAVRAGFVATDGQQDLDNVHVSLRGQALRVLCPADMTVIAPTAAGAVVSGSPVVMGGTGAAGFVSTHASTQYAVGNTHVSVSAFDSAGNTASCSYEVRVLAPRSTFQDFEQPGTPYTAINGYSASMSIRDGGPSGRYLSLTTGYSQVGSIGFDLTDNEPFGKLIADFDFRHGPWQYGENGLAFMLLDSASYGLTGAPSTETRAESGAVNSLTIGLSTYDVSQVYLQFNNVLADKVPTPFDLRDGLFHHYRLTLVPSGTAVGGLSATLIIDPDGSTPAEVFKDVVIPGAMPYAARAAFVATNGQQDLANVAVQFSSAVNQPPVANAGPEQVVHVGADCRAAVTLDGTASTDPDGDALSWLWSGVFGATTGATPAVVVPLGQNAISLVVTDAAGLSSTASVTVKAIDVTPPAVSSVTPSSATLWPPDHKLVPVAVAVQATDNCSAVNSRIVSVSSNEPGGGEWSLTGPLSLLLRAERNGGGAGRVYLIGIESRDAAGNVTTSAARVSVPHDQR